MTEPYAWGSVKGPIPMLPFKYSNKHDEGLYSKRVKESALPIRSVRHQYTYDPNPHSQWGPVLKKNAHVVAEQAKYNNYSRQEHKQNMRFHINDTSMSSRAQNLPHRLQNYDCLNSIKRLRLDPDWINPHKIYGYIVGGKYVYRNRRSDELPTMGVRDYVTNGAGAIRRREQDMTVHLDAGKRYGTTADSHRYNNLSNRKFHPTVGMRGCKTIKNYKYQDLKRGELYPTRQAPDQRKAIPLRHPNSRILLSRESKPIRIRYTNSKPRHMKTRVKRIPESEGTYPKWSEYMLRTDANKRMYKT